MEKDKFTIKAYNDRYKQQILAVWERSVLATHDFLNRSDFYEIKKLVQSFDFNDLQMYCLVKGELVLGFVGVADRKVEMLFLDPAYFRQGLGKSLVDFAIKELDADKVDVNEQNVNALKFYQKNGFVVFDRSDRDDHGRNYPLLRMKLT